jgi:sugar lactone lactonase YvrE
MWHPGEQACYWVDWYGPIIRRLRWGQEKIESWTIPGETIIGSFVFARDGRLLIAVDSGLRLFDPRTGTSTPFADPNERRPGVAYNDSKLESSGRLWVGTFDLPETEPRGILYCVEPDGRWGVGDSGFAVCNGPAFSPDGRTLYFSDSVGRRVLAYDLSPQHRTLANRRVFAQFKADEGVPDGLTVDAEGGVWIAMWDGWRVARYTPDGMLDRVIHLPVPRPTSCCFGGDDLGTLYVTSARVRLSAAQLAEAPLSGSVFAVDARGARGLVEPAFRG